jgi:hypothetical protein
MSTPNDFVTILAQLDDGNVAAHLTEQLRRLTIGVLDTGKKGSLTLRINVDAEGRMLVLKSKIDAKVPQADTDASMFFADKEGFLRKDDPQQVPLRGVPTKPPTPLRSIDKPNDNAQEA